MEILVKNFQLNLRGQNTLLNAFPALKTSTLSPIFAINAFKYVCLQLQILSGQPVSMSRSCKTSHPEQFLVIVQFCQKKVGEKALTMTEEMLSSVLRQGSHETTEINLNKIINELQDLSVYSLPGSFMDSILKSCKSRSIPIMKTGASTFQLGWGSKQKRCKCVERNIDISDQDEGYAQNSI
jgi:hypothetical protein